MSGFIGVLYCSFCDNKKICVCLNTTGIHSVLYFFVYRLLKWITYLRVRTHVVFEYMHAHTT